MSCVVSEHKPGAECAPVNVDGLDIVGVRHWIKNL